MPYFLTAVPNWTVPYDMPSTALNSSMMNILGDSLKISIKAMGSTGVIILGVVFSVYLIASIFFTILGRRTKFNNAVDKKVFERAVHEEDVYRNFDDVVNNGLLDKSLRRYINRADIWRNEGEIIDDNVRQREMKHLSDKAYRAAHREWDIEDATYRIGVNDEARERYANSNIAYFKHRESRVDKIYVPREGDSVGKIYLPHHREYLPYEIE